MGVADHRRDVHCDRGVTAFVAALLGFYDVAIEVQWAVFLVGGAVLWIAFYRWAKKFLRDHVLPPGVGAERLVGMTGTVTESIVPDDPARRGRIAVVGEVWGALVTGGGALAEGTKIRITSMQGTRVIVEPVDNEGDSNQ